MPKLDFSKVPLIKENGDDTSITTEVYDPKPFSDNLKQHDTRIKLICEQADKVVVKDDDTANSAIDLAGNIKKALDMIDDQFKEHTDAHNTYVKAVQKVRDFWKKPLNKAYKHLTGLLGLYEHQKEVQRLRDEKFAKEQAEALQKKIKADAKAAGVKAPEITIPVTTKKETMRGEKGTLITKKRWTWEVMDEDKVPRQYLKIDNKALTTAVRAGERNIKGVRIFETYDAGIRTK